MLARVHWGGMGWKAFAALGKRLELSELQICLTAKGRGQL